jgi:hypothetical protein
LTPEIDGIVNRTPTFSWEQATDPDGDTVTYDLYVDSQENPSTLIAENLSTTSFELTENLDFETQYYWKVVAKDDKEASTEIARPLIIVAPIKWLRIYNPNDEVGSTEFHYINGKLNNLGALFFDLQSAPSKLERVRDFNSIPTHEYQYTTTGKQREVYNGDGVEGDRWTFEYDDSDKLSSITKETRIDQGLGGFDIVLGKALFEYNEAANVNPTQIDIYDGDDMEFRYSLQWEGNNIVSVLVERKGMGGSGLEVQGNVKIEYDDSINPYYMIISNQFGFAPFHVLTDSPAGLESFDFNIFKWQSFNNITAFEVFDDPSAVEPTEGYSVNYDYSEDYYPISASFFNISTNTTNQINWSYLDE